MANITPAPVIPVQAPYNTTPSYSGTFIPTIWSGKMTARFYEASTYVAVANHDWEGEITGGGTDKVIIRNPPLITISNYRPGQNLTYQVPTPDTQELLVDRAKSFSFRCDDVLAYQADIKLVDEFSRAASESMRVAVDSNMLYATFNTTAAANKGAGAGVKSAGYDLGTDAAPVVLTAANVVQKVLELAAVLDEQNVPEEGRWLVIDPAMRVLLFQSDLAKVFVTGDDASPVRNGKVGMIDRFTVYVSNLLPRGAAGSAQPWISGDGSENTVTTVGTVAKRKAIIAGHKAALTFAGQMTKVESLRNQDAFGDLVRGLNVYGGKTVMPVAQALLVAAG